MRQEGQEKTKGVWSLLTVWRLIDFSYYILFSSSVIDIQHCISLRYTAQGFDLHTSCNDCTFSEHPPSL